MLAGPWAVGRWTASSVPPLVDSPDAHSEPGASQAGAGSLRPLPAPGQQTPASSASCQCAAHTACPPPKWDHWLPTMSFPAKDQAQLKGPQLVCCIPKPASTGTEPRAGARPPNPFHCARPPSQTSLCLSREAGRSEAGREGEILSHGPPSPALSLGPAHEGRPVLGFVWKGGRAGEGDWASPPGSAVAQRRGSGRAASCRNRAVPSSPAPSSCRGL